MLARILLAATAATATFVLATPALAGPNIQVVIDPPAPTYVYDSAAYRVGVSNLGTNATDVFVTIELPETDTPQVEVLGSVIDIDSRCILVGSQLACDLGVVPPGTTTYLKFGLALPWANRTLEVTATADSSGWLLDTDTLVGALEYYAVQVQAGQHWTDVCWFWPHVYSSYFECTIAPGSSSSGYFDFDANGNVWLANVPGVFGSWWQPSAEQLVFTYDHGGIVGVEQFEGWGVNSNCFEGQSSYPFTGVVHPRQICFF